MGILEKLLVTVGFAFGGLVFIGAAMESNAMSMIGITGMLFSFGLLVVREVWRE